MKTVELTQRVISAKDIEAAANAVSTETLLARSRSARSRTLPMASGIDSTSPPS